MLKMSLSPVCGLYDRLALKNTICSLKSQHKAQQDVYLLTLQLSWAYNTCSRWAEMEKWI